MSLCTKISSELRIKTSSEFAQRLICHLYGGRAASGGTKLLLIFDNGRISHLKMAEPFLGFLILFGEGSVFIQKAGQRITVNPDFIVSFLLGFVKNKL